MVDREEVNDPSMATSDVMIGSSIAWAEGYTGAGTRIAVIDTGTDTDHQSFNAEAFSYSLAYQAGLLDMEVNAYLESLNLLDVEEIASVFDQLNIAGSVGDPANLYLNVKLPFGYNYVDEDLDITHDNDLQGSHGSHVAGISTANTYIPSGEGGFVDALETVFVQGVAPDAQLLTMKVFGKMGGAYDSDYMVAIEDAIILGCDAINLSLGSSSPGFARSASYEEIMENLENSDTVVAIAAGNSGHWADSSYALPGYLYGDDVSMDTTGAPGSFTNALTVASVDNDGRTDNYMKVADHILFYNENSRLTYAVDSMTTLAGEHAYVYIDSIGTAEEFAAIADVLQGKIALCNRGTTAFSEKANAAVQNGAIATIIINNTDESINMDLSTYEHTNPCVMITSLAGEQIKAASQAVTDEEGNVLYYTGKITVGGTFTAAPAYSDYYTMSIFSSWGVPGDLSMKPEITAPGGSIYSVNGVDTSGTAYETMSGTSMAAPQVAGMAALVAQYIRENDLDEKTGMSPRQLAQSLLMSTAAPMTEEESGYVYSILRQGAGLANVGSAIAASSYIFMGEDATEAANDGKVKVELGDDPRKTGAYTWSFTVNNMTEEALGYTLLTELCTQGIFETSGYTWLDTWTTPLIADITYTVDGETFVPTYPITADVDLDGDTDRDDALAALEYAMGTRTADGLDLAVADQNGDEKVTTYDAHLLLNRAYTEVFTVPANGSVTVTVSAVLTEAQKEALNAGYENGAYIEGYTYVNPVATGEGALLDVTHSIPVLGFYGNWSDASMFDRQTAAGYIYGDTTPPYTGQVSTNNLVYRYEGDKTAYYMVGNPYFMEETLRLDRNAINSESTIYLYALSMIRNASVVFAEITDQNGELLYRTALNDQIASAYYHVNGGQWQKTVGQLLMDKEPGSLGAQEGDVLEVRLYAIPEYYEVDGPLTNEQIDELLASGMLGEGVCLSTTMTVDDTAPKLLNANKGLMDHTLTIEAQDNNYVAYMAVLNEFGARIFVEALPNEHGHNEVTAYTFDLTGIPVGEYCTVMLGDYAGNESSYLLHYGGEGEDFSNKMYGFTNGTTYHGEGDRWVEIDPNTLFFYYDSATKTSDYGGIQNVAYTDVGDVLQGEYVDGYVFMTTEELNTTTGNYDTTMYVAPHEDLTLAEQVAVYENVRIRGMAYSYADKKMYILSNPDRSSTSDPTAGINTIYSMDLSTGKLTEEYTLTLYRPGEHHGTYPMTDYRLECLKGLAIDDEGNFYAMSHGGKSGINASYFYSWSNKDVKDGTIEELPPVNEQNIVGFSSVYSSLAWDHDNDVLYAAACASSSQGNDNVLITIDTETGIGERATVYDGGHNRDCASVLRMAIAGLYIVPSNAGRLPYAKVATEVWIEPGEVTIMQGTEYTLQTAVYPWNLEDNSVTWTTSDASVATVNEKGKVTAIAPGTATITATANSNRDVSSSATVNVVEVPDYALEALIYDADGKAYWSEFSTAEPENWTAIKEADRSYVAGGMYQGKLYAHDGSTGLYVIDPETYESAFLGELGANNMFSDAADCPPLSTDVARQMGLAILSYGGQNLHVIDFSRNGVWYFGMVPFLGTDKMAAIAFRGQVKEIQGRTTTTRNQYYILAEDGTLYSGAVSLVTMGSVIQNPSAGLGAIGDLDIDLGNVSDPNSNQAASMEYDPETGYLILSTHYMDQVNEIYVIDPVNMNFVKVGELGDDVWPAVCLRLKQEATEEEQPADHLTEAEAMWLMDEENTVEATFMTMEEYADQNADSLNSAASGNENVVVDGEAGTVTVNFNEELTTNGIHSVAYDASVLTFVGAEGNAELSVIKTEEGKVSLGYANTFAATCGASFTFTYEESLLDAETAIELITTHQGDLEEETSETVTVLLPGTCQHETIEVRDAREATCTEEGYTGDTYCLDCGKLVSAGETIPATGHTTELVDTKEPTCTEDGYTGDEICTVCGETVEQGEVIPADCPSAGFADVPLGEWYHDYVDCAVERGLMQGMSDTKFAPGGALTRAMMVTTLYRLAGTPDVELTDKFSDVADDQWYSKAVAWAAENNIVVGMTETTFEPGRDITREQAATILYRYVTVYLGLEPTEGADLSQFSDSAAISDYAADALAWAVAEGLFEGFPNGTLQPKTTLTRAQMAKLLTILTEKF